MGWMRFQMRDIPAAGALAVSAALPWSYPINAANFPSTRGLAAPGFWLTALALLMVMAARSRRLASAGLALAAVGLFSWPVLLQTELLRPGFTDPYFPFQLVDVLDTGWYLGLVAWGLLAESRAREAAETGSEPRRAVLAAWSLLPGLGLVRYQLVGRGRFWLLLVGVLVLWVHSAGVPQAEMDFANVNHYIPEPFLRNAYFIDLGLVVLAWLLSLVDTWRQVRLWDRSANAPNWLHGWIGRRG